MKELNEMNRINNSPQKIKPRSSFSKFKAAKKKSLLITAASSVQHGKIANLSSKELTQK